MLERVALHQTRFRTPGVSPDTRGILLGQKGLVLFQSLDRLVAFLRAYGQQGSLNELLPSLQIRRIITPLKTREVMLLVNAESSYRMDRIAGVAKLAGGLPFTGTSKHYVKYRDAASPLGYDLGRMAESGTDLVLYHDTFEQSYEYGTEITFRDLVMQLSPHPIGTGSGQTGASQDDSLARVYAAAEPGVGHAVIGYLFRWAVDAHVAIAEWGAQSAFDDGPKRLHVFEILAPPPRIVGLLRSLPGVSVFDPVSSQAAVEVGYEHPIALDSASNVFEEPELVLFQGDGQVHRITPVPPFAPVASLIRNDLQLVDSKTGHFESEAANAPIALPLRLAPSPEPWSNVIATVVPVAEREWLARLLYALPPSTLQALRMAIGPDSIYILHPSGIEGVPLGRFYSEVAERVYAPAGMTVVPALSTQVLSELTSSRKDGHLFFEPEHEHPRLVENASFGPVSRRAIQDVRAEPVSADRPDNAEPELPIFQYDEIRRFPLWGVPGKEESGADS